MLCLGKCVQRRLAFTVELSAPRRALVGTGGWTRGGAEAGLGQTGREDDGGGADKKICLDKLIRR